MEFINTMCDNISINVRRGKMEVHCCKGLTLCEVLQYHLKVDWEIKMDAINTKVTTKITHPRANKTTKEIKLESLKNTVHSKDDSHKPTPLYIKNYMKCKLFPASLGLLKSPSEEHSSLISRFNPQIRC